MRAKTFSLAVDYLRDRNKLIYRSVISLMLALMVLDYIPFCQPYVAWLTPPVALFLGLSFALICDHAYPTFNAKMSKALLQYSVIGLGFGMNLQAALLSGSKGMYFTIISVAGTILLGSFIGVKLLKMNKKTSYLVSSGTAICGGSAIAAVAPVIDAKQSETSVALATIFILNAVALFIFPSIGHYLGLTQQEFGTWAAIAIHDTSSVVGAGAAYGEEALKVATTIKLTRALWIIPVSLVTMLFFKNKGKKIKLPYFIFWFIAAMIFNTYFLSDFCPMLGSFLNGLGRKGLTLSLFFIGASLSLGDIQKVGVRPLLQGVLLWLIISVSTLGFILWT